MHRSSRAKGLGTKTSSHPIGHPVVVPESIELRFSTALAAPFAVVWERVVSVRGANDELWPFAKMTFPLRLDRHTPPEQVVGKEFHSWMLVFGFLPVDRRTMQIEVFEEGRFRERSQSWMQGRWCHERAVEPAEDGATVLTDSLLLEPRSRVAGALMRPALTATFRRRHRRLRRHFEKASA
jgi:ligand-binding SRPBCC domain-containing protein